MSQLRKALLSKLNLYIIPHPVFATFLSYRKLNRRPLYDTPVPLRLPGTHRGICYPRGVQAEAMRIARSAHFKPQLLKATNVNHTHNTHPKSVGPIGASFSRTCQKPRVSAHITHTAPVTEVCCTCSVGLCHSHFFYELDPSRFLYHFSHFLALSTNPKPPQFISTRKVRALSFFLSVSFSTSFFFLVLKVFGYVNLCVYCMMKLSYGGRKCGYVCFLWRKTRL